MSGHKVGDKFEIEIGAVLKNATGKGNPLYRIKGFASLVFDDNGLSILERIARESEKDKEPEVDWSKVTVGTPVLVRNTSEGEWRKRYFAGYNEPLVKTFLNGGTSWSASGATTNWIYAKLAESEEEEE